MNHPDDDEVWGVLHRDLHPEQYLGGRLWVNYVPEGVMTRSLGGLSRGRDDQSCSFCDERPKVPILLGYGVAMCWQCGLHFARAFRRNDKRITTKAWGIAQEEYERCLQLAKLKEARRLLAETRKLNKRRLEARKSHGEASAQEMT